MPEEEKSTAKTVDEEEQETVEETVDHAKEEAGDSTSTSASTTANKAMSSGKNILDSAKGMLESLKSWGKAAGVTAGKVWSAVGGWNEGGTPLRGYIKDAREGLDDVTTNLRTHTDLLDQTARKRIDEIGKGLRTRFEEFDKSKMIAKVSEAGRQHPELVVGGVTLGVALPSALVGRGLRNGALACTLTAGVVYGGPWFQRRILPKLKGEKDNDESKRS